MTLIVSGQVVDLSHLRTIERKMEIPLRGGFKKAVNLEFHFSCHCYSRGPSEGEVIPPDLLVRDGSPYSPRDRIFDPRRYELSRQLTGLLDGLISANGNVFLSRHDNFFRTEIIEESAGGGIAKVPYYIFMNARTVPSSPPKAKFIKVFVESAYPELPNVAPPAFTKGTSFGELLGGLWAPGPQK